MPALAQHSAVLVVTVAAVCVQAAGSSRRTADDAPYGCYLLDLF